MTSDAARPMMMLALAVTLPLASPARVSAAPGERITSLVAGARELFALRANTVVTFDAGGREIARCPRFEAPPPTRQSALAVGPIDAQELLRLAGLPDDDFQTPEAEEVLAAEGLAPRRRARAAPTSPALPIMVHTLAASASASANDVWIATSAGLYRGRDGACARVALPGRDVIAVAAVGGAVAAATDDLLWRSTDGGGTFRVVAGMVARPRALAIVDDQRTLVATDDAVIEIGPHGAMRAVLDRGGAALAVCDGARARLHERRRLDLALATRPPSASAIGRPRGRSRAAARRPRVSSRRATACTRPPTERPGGSDAPAPARAVRRRPRSATGSGSPPMTASWRWTKWRRSTLGEAAGTPPLPALSSLPTRRLLEPVFPWPQLTLVFTAQHTPLRDGWSLVALVVFRLGRVAAARADGGRLAAELVQRDAALAAHEIELRTAPTEAAHTGRHCPRRAAARDTTRERGAAMIDPFCIGLLTLWLTQADGLSPEAPAREPARRPAASVADGGAEPGSPDRRPRDRRSDATLLRALAASDPPVDALRAAASALALTEPDRARSLVLRARLAGWLPELRGGFYRRFARAESVDLGASRVDAARAGRN